MDDRPEGPVGGYAPGMVSELGVERPLRRAEYDQLVEAGAFEGEHLELIEGKLVLMSPEGPRHADVQSVVSELLTLALHGRARIRHGNPLAVSDTSEPEPDVSVVPLGDYRAAHPETALLAVEVSFSSLRKDRMVKPALYAGAGVAEYWIVDLVSDAVIVLTDPVDGFYRSVRTYTSGEAVTLVAFPDVAIGVDDVLG